MDFAFSEDQQMIFEAVGELCEEELKPKADEVDRAGEYPWESVKKLAEMDLFGIAVPEQYGGLGMDFLTWAVVGEMLSGGCTTTGAVFGAHMLAVYPIMHFGTDEQKDKFLPPLATGEKIGAFGLTEPGAGSDAGAVSTRAELVGDHYVLNGTKIFITNGGDAEVYVIIANLDPARGTRGLCAFIVEKGSPGFSFGKDEEKMAFHSLSNRELVFEDAQVPAENLLHREGRGFRVAMETLSVGRIGMAIGAVGGDRVRSGARAVRPEDLRVPGDSVYARGHGHRDRGGAAALLQVRLAQGPGRGLREDRSDGQGLRLGDVRAGDIPRGSDPRRLRIHAGLPGRAVYARGQAL